MLRRALPVVAALAALVGLAWSARSEGSCAPASERLEPVCGFRNPEDLALLPGADWLVISEMGRPLGAPGRLAGQRVTGGEIVALFPDPEPLFRLPTTATPGWGDPECPGPPQAAAFSPHGVAVWSRPLQAPVVLAVNHGEGDRVEWFEVAYGRGRPLLLWRGCVPVDAGPMANDVVGLPDGGIAVTRMAHGEGLRGLWDGLCMALGLDTGWVERWSPEAGWSRIQGSEASGPNGIAASADGARVFFGAWGSRELVRLELAGGPAPARTALPQRPDGFGWGRDGRLLMSGQTSAFAMAPCLRRTEGPCPVGWAVVAADPETLATETLLAESAEVVGGVSSVVDLGDTLVLGSFVGDRIARARRASPRQ